MEVKEPIKGLCNNKEVYVMFSMFKGQTEAKCPLSDKEINKRLNEEVTWLKDSSSYNDKGMVNIIINCKGEEVQCQIDNKTKYPELDKQVVAVFNTLGEWKAAKLSGKEVDSSRLWSFEIKNGKISVN
jgi:phage FluMu protein Com